MFFFFQSRADSEGQVLYSLYGVVQHSGNMNSGHYTAYVKVSEPTAKGLFDKITNMKDLTDFVSNMWTTDAHKKQGNSRTFHEPASAGQWFHVSDSSVSAVPETKVLKCQAYMLFYGRLPLGSRWWMVVFQEEDNIYSPRFIWVDQFYMCQRFRPTFYTNLEIRRFFSRYLFVCPSFCHARGKTSGPVTMYLVFTLRHKNTSILWWPLINLMLFRERRVILENYLCNLAGNNMLWGHSGHSC